MKAVLNRTRVTTVVAFGVAAAVLAPLSFWLFRPDSTVRATQIPEEWIGRSSPDYELKAFGSTRIALGDDPNSVCVLDFWAVSCEPCKRPVPPRSPG